MFVPGWSKSRLPIPKSPRRNGNSSHFPAVILNKMEINAVFLAEDAEQSTDPLPARRGGSRTISFSLGGGARRRGSQERAISPLCFCTQAAPSPLAEPEGLTQNPREPRRGAGRPAHWWKDPQSVQHICKGKALTRSGSAFCRFSSSFQSY